MMTSEPCPHGTTEGICLQCEYGTTQRIAVLRTAHHYPATYGSSSIQIDLTCDCHPRVWGGRGQRTGLRSDHANPPTDRPVYILHTTEHQELKGRFVMLLEDGTLDLYDR